MIPMFAPVSLIAAAASFVPSTAFFELSRIKYLEEHTLVADTEIPRSYGQLTPPKHPTVSNHGQE